jgi:histidinol-phosphate aminotransferase
MPSSLFSRRDFSRAIGTSLAVAWAAPGLAPALHAGKPNSASAEPASESPIRLSFNENPYGPSPKAFEAFSSCGRIAARYPFATYPQVLDALAQKYGVARENIVLGCGSTEILRSVDMAFLGPGKNVVAAEPTFEAVLEYARFTRAEPVKVSLTADHRHDLPKMAAACTSKTGVVYVCNPNNPTGTINTREEVDAFIQAVPSSALILVDEAYYDFADDPHYGTAAEWTKKNPNVVVARTFSKLHGMAGMRLGYAVGAKETIARMGQCMTMDNGNAAVLSAALASLGDTEYLASCRNRLNSTRSWLCSELSKDGRSFIPSQANFLMIDMGTNVLPIIEQFRARNILVGRLFPSMSNFLRVTIGTQPETEAFLSALREIAPATASRAA